MNVLILSILLFASIIPSAFGWEGLMAMDGDKRNVQYGEIINYEGFLYGEYPIEGEQVYVTVSEQETGLVIAQYNLTPSSKAIDYFGNTAWPFEFMVDTSRNYEDDTAYVVEAKYDDKSTKLNFLIKPDTKIAFEEKAIEAGEAIVEAGKEAGKVIVDVGEEAIEKGSEVEKAVDEKRIEVKETVEQKGSEAIEEIGEVGGCLIATATFDSELSLQVQQLREIRDNQLLQTESGTWFMQEFNKVYYSFSPLIADYERENPIFKEAVKLSLTPLLSSLTILNYVDLDSEEKVLGYGISLILLNLGMYLGAPVAILIGIKKRI